MLPEHPNQPTDDQIASDIETAALLDRRLARPSFFRREIAALFRLALPVTLAYLLQSSINVIALFSVGPLGPVSIGAVALGNMYLNVTACSVIIGLASALDTLCSQAYTGANKQDMGIYLQRSLVIAWTACIPMAVLAWFSGDILIWTGQDPTISHLVAEFTRWTIPLLPFYAAFESLKRFLQAQGIMSAATQVLFITVPLHFFLSIYLVHHIGFKGAPIALSITECVTFILLLVYTAYIHPTAAEAWNGWSLRACFTQWSNYLSLGIAGVLQVCSEWWAFEIVSLAAGYLGPDPLAAQSIMLNVAGLVYMVPLGISVAASTRVGNFVGAQKPKSAKRSAKATLLLMCFTSLVNTTLIFFGKTSIAWIFTDDVDVAFYVCQLAPIVALFQLADGINGGAAGILRGVGRQSIGATFNLLAYYVLALPIGLTLAFPYQMGVQGLWWGLFGGLFFAALCETWVVIFGLNWRNEVERCQVRLQGPIDEDEEVSVATRSRPRSFEENV